MYFQGAGSAARVAEARVAGAGDAGQRGGAAGGRADAAGGAPRAYRHVGRPPRLLARHRAQRRGACTASNNYIVA